MNTTPSFPNPRTNWLIIPVILGLAHFLIHVLTNGNYGMFRDEFYYIACSDHLAWGYVDHPPLSVGLLAASRAVLGDSVQAIRLLPVIVGALVVFLTGLLARELGGHRFAQTVAALCAMIVPSYLVMTGFFSMNALDLLFWAVVFLLVIRIIKTDNKKLWLLLGTVVGLGLLNKISMLFFGFGLVAGLLFTPQRKHFLDKYLWMGGAIAFLIFLPHILWQVANDWPTLEFISNAKQYKIAELGPVQFLLGQIVENHPLNFPIWLVGLGWLLFAREGHRYRLLGLIYVIAFVLFVVQRSKVYYLAPAYTVLLAAGGCAVEGFLHRRRWNWAGPMVVGILLIGGILTLPMGVPILPVETFLVYQEHIGLKPAPAEEGFEGSTLPQHFADRFGWENMTATVASVYESLTPEQQAECVIVTRNYGQAGAINYYGHRHGLPPAISGHNNYYLWGPGDATGDVVISVGTSPEDLKDIFEEVSPAATIMSPYAMPWETNLTVYVCRGLKVPLEEVWPRVKMYI